VGAGAQPQFGRVVALDEARDVDGKIYPAATSP
jgi:hypothetical protein